MTERRGDQGFSVAPSRVDGTGGGWRGRRRRITTWLVLAAAVAVVAVAVLGPRLQQRPSLDLSFLATPTPTTRPSATPTLRPGATPAVTPLPELFRGDGPIPPGRIGVQTDIFRVLDPTAGTVTDGPSLEYGQAALLRSADGTGWTCICLVDDVVDDVVSRIVRVVDIDETGHQASFADVTVLGPLVGSTDGPPPLTNAVDTTGDGSVAILAVARRQPDETFAFSAAGLSMGERNVSPFTGIGTASAPAPGPGPSPSRSPEPGLPPSQVHLDGPHLRVAPDGTMAFMWARIQREVHEGPAPTSIVAWRLDLRSDGSVASVADAPTLAAMPPYCEYAGFVTADRFAWFCPLGDQAGPSPSASWALQLFGLDGSDAGRISVPDAGPRYLGEPLFDRANGAAYVWDPFGLVLYRFNLRRMSVERVVFDPAAEVASGVEPGGGSERPDWHDADSALYPFGYGEIAADGSRLFLVGFREQPAPDAQSQASLGIFVVDRSTLALVDRWAPTTNYQMLAMALDGKAVAATSFAGAGTDGRPAPWESALTLHDVADGRVIAQFGQLGQGWAPFVIER